MSSYTHNEDDEASTTSLTSEESHEPYFNTHTGAIVSAREAWHFLSKHDDRYKSKLDKKSLAGGGAAPRAASDSSPTIDQDEKDETLDEYQSSDVADTAPSQSSIDRALHPDLHSPSKPPKVDADHPSLLDEVDEDILRAQAMALSASGQKLTPEQILLIARPDVQQQKLIEETRRKAQAQLAAKQSHSAAGGIKQMGADLKKFIDKEQKNVMEWGSEMGKFIEETGLKLGGTSGSEEKKVVEEKKVEGLGSTGTPRTPAGSEEQVLERRNSNGSAKSSECSDNNIIPTTKPNSLWSSMPAIPTLPTLHAAFPISKHTSIIKEEDPPRISAVLWKRRSGFGKHSTLKAWERRLVELRGNKLMYHASPEEEQQLQENKEEGRRKSSIFEQAASTAEHKLQSLGNDFSRMVQAAGIESLKPPSSGASTPRGVLDIVKENATVAASCGHSGSPTPFCISIKVKSETKWKFCMDNHGMLMEWLAALTDVVVRASVDAASRGGDGESSAREKGVWEIQEYSIRLKNENESSHKFDVVERQIVGGIDRESSVRNAASLTTNTASDDTLADWALTGQNLKMTWIVFNLALLLARSSALSIERYWWMVVLVNFGVWQLCTRSIDPSKLMRVASKKVGIEDRSMPLDTSMTKITSPIPKVIPGSTCIQVSSVTDPNTTKSGRKLPMWIPVSSSSLEVRSHGYLTTKKKIPSPGELYECIAVDCFQSDACHTHIASRVLLPKPDEVDKRWKSPELFVASITIPTEAPKFSMGQATTTEGPGTTIIGYFKMKESTREILQRITADDYDPASTDESEVDVQKRIANGVRLWEKYCKQAPSDSSFQARFKLVPSLNMSELGCPAYISKYNGKPVLIKRAGVTGFFSDYPSLNAMEFDISLHPFPYLFKQGMAYFKENYFDKAVGTFGFVIEGRDDDELPEVVIGAMQICYPSPQYVATSEEFFGGGLNSSLLD